MAHLAPACGGSAAPDYIEKSIALGAQEAVHPAVAAMKKISLLNRVDSNQDMCQASHWRLAVTAQRPQASLCSRMCPLAKAADLQYQVPLPCGPALQECQSTGGQHWLAHSRALSAAWRHSCASFSSCRSNWLVLQACTSARTEF